MWMPTLSVGRARKPGYIQDCWTLYTLSLKGIAYLLYSSNFQIWNSYITAKEFYVPTILDLIST
jgi:hypothetical protein